MCKSNYSIPVLKNYIKHKRWQAGMWQPFFKILWNSYNAYRFMLTPAYRSRIWYSLKYRKQYHQFSNFTKLNRYPVLFSIAQGYFTNYSKLKILSFGCATGEEVESLSIYLPQAQIVGADINPWCLKEATKRCPKHRFVHSQSPQFEALEGFDAIFCLAVFQHSANRHDINQKKSEYLFTQFEEQLSVLDKKLNPNGLLFIDHCDFNFLETSLSKQYRIADVQPNRISRNRPLFNKHNQKVSITQQNFRIFRKI